MSVDVVLGLDLGTTSAKVVAFDANGLALAKSSRPTAWYADQPGGSCLDLPGLLTNVSEALVDVAEELDLQGRRPAALGITGMAETGVLLDAGDHPLWPAIAWHDGRGADQLQRVAAALPRIREDFSYRTGLPWDAQASFAKIAWLVEHFPTSRGQVWLSIPEYVAYALTGTAAAERTLASRTGLVDHTVEGPWLDAFDAVGLDLSVLPSIRSAESGWGAALQMPRAAALQPAAAAMAGITVTVAGHDHIVAARGAGIDKAGQVFNSCGTADVVLRVVDAWPDPTAFENLSAMNVSMGFHTRPGQFVVNGGTKAGYLLRRVTDLVGPAPQTPFIATTSPIDADGNGLSVQVPAFGDDEIVIKIRGEVSPDALWAMALEAASQRSKESMAVVEAAFGPYSGVVCGGGWTRVDAVRRMKARTYRDVSFTDIDEPGCLGAARAAADAALAAGVEQTRQLGEPLAHADGEPMAPSQSGE